MDARVAVTGARHCGVGRADVIKLGHGQFALVEAPSAQNSVTLAEAQALALHVVGSAPSPGLKRFEGEMLQADIDVRVGLGGVHPLDDVLGELVEAQDGPAITQRVPGDHNPYVSS